MKYLTRFAYSIFAAFLVMVILSHVFRFVTRVTPKPVPTIADVEEPKPPRHTEMPPGFTLVVGLEGEYAAQRSSGTGLILEHLDRDKTTKQDAIDRAWHQYKYEGGAGYWKPVEEKKEPDLEGVRTVTMPDLSGTDVIFPFKGLLLHDGDDHRPTITIQGLKGDIDSRDRFIYQRPALPETCTVRLWTKDGTEWIAKWEVKK